VAKGVFIPRCNWPRKKQLSCRPITAGYIVFVFVSFSFRFRFVADFLSLCHRRCIRNLQSSESNFGPKRARAAQREETHLVDWGQGDTLVLARARGSVSLANFLASLAIFGGHLQFWPRRGSDARGRQNLGPSKRPEALFEWRIGVNGARRLAYEVAAAAAPRRGIPSSRRGLRGGRTGGFAAAARPRRLGACQFLESFEWKTTV